MTADNVLDLCDNLNQLELDYNKWNLLTDDQKRISNDICIQKYGMNNIELYQKQKTRLTVLEEAVMMLSDDTMKALNNKVIQTKVAKENNPMIVIIPLVDVEPLSIDLMYQNYLQLPQNYKNMSNGESLRIWGVTVDDAYKKVKGIMTGIDAEKDLDEMPKDTFIENAFSNIYNILHGNSDRVTLTPESFDFTNDIPQIVPLLTYTEYCNLFPDKKLTVSDYINISDTKKYYELIESMQVQLEFTIDKKKKKELEDGILKLGWFPYRKINDKSVKDARDKQAEWFNKNMQTNIIDLTDYDISDTSEPTITSLTTEQMLEGTLGIEGDKSRLEPLFMTFTSSNNFLGKVIKKWTKSYWSHAGIALSSKLDKIYTFSAKELNENNREGGFRIESLDLYSSLKINDLLVLCFFVDKDIKKKVKQELSFYEKNQANTKYDKANYFNIAFNIEKDGDSMQMVCSQFVDYILKLAGIDITNKSSNLVTPGDLSKTDNNAINIYALFEGKIPNYKQKEIDKKIKLIVDTLDYEKLNATTTDNMRSTTKSTKVMESFLEVCTDNEEINNILRQVRSYMSPENNMISINPDKINELCIRNHNELMKCSHADTDTIKALLYENRGLSLYLQNHTDNEYQDKINELAIDFKMYKGILDKVSSVSNLSGFAKYYVDKIDGYGFKYDGLHTI